MVMIILILVAIVSNIVATLYLPGFIAMATWPAALVLGLCLGERFARWQAGR